MRVEAPEFFIKWLCGLSQEQRNEMWLYTDCFGNCYGASMCEDIEKKLAKFWMDAAEDLCDTEE